jgi:hypothetical protein
MCDMKCVGNILVSISFSLFGMLLIFGLGFVFPTINPYVVIKWIIIVCAIAFVYPWLYCLVGFVKGMIMKNKKKGAKK